MSPRDVSLSWSTLASVCSQDDCICFRLVFSCMNGAPVVWTTPDQVVPQQLHLTSFPRREAVIQRTPLFSLHRKDKNQNESGTFFSFSSGSSELEEKGKRLWLFKVRKKGLGVREMEIMCVWGVQLVQFIFKLVLIWRACFPSGLH